MNTSSPRKLRYAIYTLSLTPLAGGVSSDIYLPQTAGRRFVVKRALQKLKVKAH